jgi:plasmid stabilization system protein ParE
MRRVRFLDIAQTELDSAVAYYDQIHVSLSKRFISEIGAALDFIRDFPEASPSTPLGARRRNLKRFPYYLLYRLSGADIIVTAVAHVSRHPERWRGR